MHKNGWVFLPRNCRWQSSTLPLLRTSWMIWRPHDPMAHAVAMLGSPRSFYHYAALKAPQHAQLIQRVLAIPYKRLAQRLVSYLTRPELEAGLARIDQSTCVRRRNY